MGLFEHIHIKSNTAGSSNELSFDVLQKASNQTDAPSTSANISSLKGKGGAINLSKIDAARRAANDAYAKNKGKGAHRRNGGLSKGIATQSGTLADLPEVAQRKRARRGFHIITRVGIGALIIVLLCFGIFLNDRITQDRMSFKSQITNLTMQLANIDKDLVIVDQLSTDPLAPNSSEKIQSENEKIPGIMNLLSDIEDQAQRIQEVQPPGYDAEALNELIASTRAREELIKKASALFEVTLQASTYIQEADAVWNLIVDAAEISSSDAISSQTASLEALERDNENLGDALYDLSMAQREIEFMKTNMKGIDLSVYSNFIDAKKEALQYALDTNSALIEMDRNKAQEANAKYNAAALEATDFANAITRTISDAVTEFYEGSINEAQNGYETARETVVRADALLRQRIA